MCIAKLELNVIKSLSKQGIKPICRNVGGKTAVSYTRNGKNYTQLYDAEGKLLKFKIHDKTTGKITKSEFYRTNDSLMVDRFDKSVSGTERTGIYKTDKFIQMEKRGGSFGDESTTVFGENDILEGFKGSVERRGGLNPMYKEYGNKPLFEPAPLSNEYPLPQEIPPVAAETAAVSSEIPWWEYALATGGLLGGVALITKNNKKKEEKIDFQCNATPPSMRG